MRAAAAVAVSLALGGCGGERLQGDLLLRADRVFDGRAVVEGGEVLIAGDEVVAVGDLDAEAERTIDLGDATVMPGVIDLHVHNTAGARMRSAMLRGGVTTVRDLGAPIGLLDEMTAAPELRVIAAGPIVTARGGYPIPIWGRAIALEVRGEQQARAAVADLDRRGAGVIKIAHAPVFGGGPALTLAEMRAIADEAHARGLTVVVHADGPTPMAEAGVDELAHMVCGAVGDATWRQLIDAKIEIVATLHVLGGYHSCIDAAARFHELGGTLLYGSDYGNAGIPIGIDAQELRLLRDAGLTPEEVLAAATSRAAAHLGLAPLGALQPGAPADVIAVPGNALDLRDDMNRPLVVVRAGRVVHENLR